MLWQQVNIITISYTKLYIMIYICQMTESLNSCKAERGQLKSRGNSAKQGTGLQSMMRINFKNTLR